MNQEALSAWLKLALIEDLGPAKARELLTSFGLPQHIFTASYAHLSQLVGEKTAHVLSQTLSAETQAQIDKTLHWLTGDRRAVLTLADAHYPQILLNTHDPPILLYALGDLNVLQHDAIAVVGSRNATPQGIKNAQNFSAEFARQGLVVVSGLALGIDGAAHAGALEAQGMTVAVIGTGADIVYPSRHRALAHRIVDNGGLILSEFPLGMPALPHQFPRRNRIISGLSRGVMVVEAAVNSGSLITARLAAEQGREVFAIPGSIHSPQARGCHKLIKQGAKLVESADDVMTELQWNISSSASVSLDTSASESQDVWLNAVGYDPFTLDELMQRSGAPVAELNARLLDWELEGKISVLPGGRWQRG